MKVLKQISVYVLLLIIVFSSLGISFYLHQCHCHQTLYVSLGTAFTEPKASVCGTSCSTVSHRNNDNLSIGKKGCCRDYLYFYLLPVAPDYAAPQIASASQIQLFVPTTTTIEMVEISPSKEIIPFFHHPPPLLSGKSLVYFIQQIKIPFPAC